VAALQLEPDNPSALLNKGITCLNLGQNQAALTCFNRLLNLGANQSVVWKNKGTALYRLGDIKGAVGAYDEALRLKPDDQKVHELKERAKKMLR
jgi:DEAD/DEAH box helicase domain-containing protein